MDLKLTTRSQEAMAAAVRRAATDGHPQVEPAHLLAALLEQTDGVAPALLAAAGADVAALKTAADRGLAALPSASGSSVSSPGLGRPPTRRCPPPVRWPASWVTSTSPPSIC